MRRFFVFAFVFAVAFATVAAAAPVASPSPRDEMLARRGTLERAVVRELNRVRQARGLRPLRFGGGLRTAAALHSKTMLELGFFEHESPDGTTFDNRIRRYYPNRGWHMWAVGETLLASSVEIDAREVVSTWLESPPHRSVILSPLYRDAGVGAFFADAAPGEFENGAALVVTADFGLREK